MNLLVLDDDNMIKMFWPCENDEERTTLLFRTSLKSVVASPYYIPRYMTSVYLAFSPSSLYTSNIAYSHLPS